MEIRGVSPVMNDVRPLNRVSNETYQQKDFSQHMLGRAKDDSSDKSGTRVQERVEAVNDFIAPLNSAIKFTFHEELQEYFVQVIDQSTQEVIREIPPKKFLDMYAAMAEFMGLFIDKRS